MKFDVMLTGVGGEGILTTGVMIARAANLEGYYVRGVQLRGLAQRGGVIPIVVRFGSKLEVHSPAIMQANANLVLAFEPLEAVRATYYARREKTVFVIDDYPRIPVYANLLGLPYPSMEEIVQRIKPFAKDVYIFQARRLAKKEFGKTIFGNTMLLGAATGAELIPLKVQSLRKAIEVTAPRGLEENLKAFELGLKLGKEYKI